jgi:hypothetical protein
MATIDPRVKAGQFLTQQFFHRGQLVRIDPGAKRDPVVFSVRVVVAVNVVNQSPAADRFLSQPAARLESPLLNRFLKPLIPASMAASVSSSSASGVTDPPMVKT